MPDEKPVREQDKFMLRLPDGMRERLAQEAKANRRSMNTEIVARLEKTLADTNVIYEIDNRVDDLERKMSVLWAVHEGRDPYNRDD